MTELLDQIKLVAEARAKAQETSEAKHAALADWENDNVELLESDHEAHSQVAEAEAKLRELTIKAYQETGNKAPAPGVGIREVTKLEYDPSVAFDWAVEHRMALKLDTSGFEKIVKASPLDFVRVYQEPQATIATNLNPELIKEK